MPVMPLPRILNIQDYSHNLTLILAVTDDWDFFDNFALVNLNFEISQAMTGSGDSVSTKPGGALWVFAPPY